MLLYKKMYGQNLGALCASQNPSPPCRKRERVYFMFLVLCMLHCVWTSVCNTQFVLFDRLQFRNLSRVSNMSGI